MKMMNLIKSSLFAWVVVSWAASEIACADGLSFSYANLFKNTQAKDLGYFHFNLDLQTLPLNELVAHVERDFGDDIEAGVSLCRLTVGIEMGTLSIILMGQGSVWVDPDFRLPGENQIFRQYPVRAVHEQKIQGISLNECLSMKLPSTPLQFDLVDAENPTSMNFAFSENLSPHISTVIDRNIFLNARTFLNMRPKMMLAAKQAPSEIGVSWLDLGDDMASPTMFLNFFSKGFNNTTPSKEELQATINF